MINNDNVSRQIRDQIEFADHRLKSRDNDKWITQWTSVENFIRSLMLLRFFRSFVSLIVAAIFFLFRINIGSLVMVSVLTVLLVFWSFAYSTSKENQVRRIMQSRNMKSTWNLATDSKNMTMTKTKRNVIQYLQYLMAKIFSVIKMV